MATARSAVKATRRTAALLAGLVVGLLVLPGVGMAAPAGPTQLGATDMALLNGVRLAGLWEMPAGQMAAEKGNNKRVREVGAEIAKQHDELDQLTVDAANKLGVQLPAEPSAQQKGWLTEMTNASGDRFDRIFVDRLRAAHGAIFPVIGAVRSGTRNETVRTLAEQANGFVMTHMTLLESTGLVRYSELPPVTMPVAPDNSLVANAKANAEFGTGLNTTVIWAVLLGAVALGGIATIRVFRGG
ncbi:DUF4142 domain-containing protein [Plantactinospora solaniradicis]|uniref:DUF4142 domain-containing protein n=1 Tax=Plantactinospora solaniradicis TaxID=1723736 RepID=A0ABW1KN67_9ACTN